jgi:hypothetical protein
LYDRRAAAWNLRRVHEAVQVQGDVAYLTGELQHYPFRDVSQHLATIDRYTTLAAEDMRSERRRATAADLLLQAPAAFLRNYVLRSGFRQNVAGLVLSGLNAYYVFLKFVKLWELERRAAFPAEAPAADDLAGPARPRAAGAPMPEAGRPESRGSSPD